MRFASSRTAVTTAAALVLAAGACAAPSGAGCETDGDSPTPVETRAATSPAPSPTPTEAQPVALAEGILTYPDTPTVRWTASAIGEGDAPGFSMFADPRSPWPMAALNVGDISPVDAGDVWITAAPPALIGLDPDTGDRVWTYNPDDGFLERCSGDLIGGDIACMVGDAPDGLWGAPTRSAIVMVDVRSGAESGSFELPAPSRAFEVTGSDIVSLMYTGPIPNPWDATLPANPYRVTRYAVDGTEIWTVDIPYVWDGFVCGECTEADVTVNETLVDALIMGQHFLLDVDTGELLHYPGVNVNDFYSSALTRDGALFTTAQDQQSPVQVDVLDGDGALVTTLPGHQVLQNGDGQLHLLTDDQALLLMDADGRVVELDPVTGATAPTGVSGPTNHIPAAPSFVGSGTSSCCRATRPWLPMTCVSPGLRSGRATRLTSRGWSLAMARCSTRSSRRARVRSSARA